MDAARDRMIVYGGSSTPGVYLDDTWELTFSPNPHWNLISASGLGPVTGATVVHATSRDEAWVLGVTPNCPSAVLRKLSLPSGSWSAVVAQGDPGVRHGAVAVFDSHRDRIVLWGGTRYEGCVGTGNAQAWALTLGNVQWSQLLPTGGGPLPVGRYALADPARDRMLVYGFTNTIGNECWSLQWGNLASVRDGVAAWPRRIAAVLPNPAAGVQRFELRLAPDDTPLALEIFDAAGRRRWSRDLKGLTTGVHHIEWDGRDHRGARLPPSVYWVRLSTRVSSESIKVLRVE